MHRRAHVLRRRIAQQLIQTPHGDSIQSGHGAIVIDSKEQRPTTVGKSGQLRRQCICVAGITFELLAAVFATNESLQEVGFGHGLIAHPLSRYCRSVPLDDLFDARQAGLQFLLPRRASQDSTGIHRVRIS